jgi:hypothetical protein
MTITPGLKAFVQTAVRLPEDRLSRVDRDWERLQPHRAVVTEVIQTGPEELRSQARALREYVMAEARRAAAERAAERLIPEDLAEAILPAARALLLRSELEKSDDPRKVRAYSALTLPYEDIISG